MFKKLVKKVNDLTEVCRYWYNDLEKCTVKVVSQFKGKTFTLCEGSLKFSKVLLPHIVTNVHNTE